jgi:2-(1,2-epoxy-1,2-dihydrophenyl)acetyl-CoA isomerase
MSESVLLERAGPVATLTLNRPESLNTLDFTMMEALVARTGALAADATLRCVVVKGAGRHFMAGGDLHTFAQMLPLAPAERKARFVALIGRLHAAIENLQRMPHPVVASVHGAVAGFGLSLMNACDLVIAADNAFFTSAYRHIGLTPDGGGSYTLPRIVGVKKAMEIMLLSERFDAQQALELGLVNRVVAAAELEAATAALVATLVAGPQRATANAKRLVNASLGNTLSRQLNAEAESFSDCTMDDDFVEGIRAFVEKRPPRFGGR